MLTSTEVHNCFVPWCNRFHLGEMNVFKNFYECPDDKQLNGILFIYPEGAFNTCTAKLHLVIPSRSTFMKKLIF